MGFVRMNSAAVCLSLFPKRRKANMFEHFSEERADTGKQNLEMRHIASFFMRHARGQLELRVLVPPICVNLVPIGG